MSDPAIVDAEYVFAEQILDTDVEQDKTSPVVNATFTDHGKPIVVFKGTSGAAESRDNGEGGYANVTDTVSQQDALTYRNRRSRTRSRPTRRPSTPTACDWRCG